MECSRCGYAGDVAAGKFREMPWNETPCSACELTQSSFGTIAFDDNRGVDSGGSHDDADNGGVPQRCGGAFGASSADSSAYALSECDPMLPLSVMSSFVHGLLSLSPRVRDTVCLRYQGLRYREIARRQGVSIAAVELQQRRAMEHWPELRALFAAKAAKQKRRRRTR